jgi:hypothetical protein
LGAIPLAGFPARSSGNPANPLADYTSVRPLVFGPNALMMIATINHVAAI